MSKKLQNCIGEWISEYLNLFVWSAWECVYSVSPVLQLHKCHYCACDGFRKGRAFRDKVILFFLFFLSSCCQLPKFVISVVKKKIEHIALFCCGLGEKPWWVRETCRGFIHISVPNEDFAVCEDKAWREGLGLWV